MSSINDPFDPRLLSGMTSGMAPAELEALKRKFIYDTTAPDLRVLTPTMMTSPSYVGHTKEQIKKAKRTLEVFSLKKKSEFVWDVVTITIAFGVGASDNIYIPADLYDSHEEALAEATARTRMSVRANASGWSEKLAVAQLEGGTLDDAELVLLKAINEYLQVTK